MEERRYHATLAFWYWCHEHKISGVELARETGYSPSLVNEVRANPRRTVSQRFVDRVQNSYAVPVDGAFFLPVGETSCRRKGDKTYGSKTLTIGCS